MMIDPIVEQYIDIDPILLRPQKPEGFSVKSFLGTLLSSASCAKVPKSEMASGGDVSEWQGKMNWDMFFDNGMQYAIIRAMINGRADAQFEVNAQTLSDQKRMFLVYGATGYPTLSNAIPYAKALANIVDGVPFLGVWWDSEASGNLSPYEMAKYNSEVLGELSVLIPNTVLEIYTRQSFWDSSVQAGNWSKYPLAAARYNTSLTCPWSDRLYIFRDWEEWRYWQDSQWWDGEKFGAASTYIDHDYFNGTLEDFKITYKVQEIPPVIDPELEKRVKALEDQMITVETRLKELEDKAHEHDVPPVDVDYMYVTAKENVPVGYAVGHDKACEGSTPPGKPVIEHPDMSERIVYVAGDKIKVYKKYAYSCKDDPNTPIILATGAVAHYVVVDGYPGKVSFIDAGKVE